eukprot:gene569-609_t
MKSFVDFKDNVESDLISLISHELRDNGIVLIRHVTNREKLSCVGSALGDIEQPREVGEGPFSVITAREDVISQRESFSSADGYSSKALPLHTDRSAKKNPPDILICVVEKQSSIDGESTLCDGKQVAEHVKSENPEFFHSLLTTSVHFQFKDGSLSAPLLEEKNGVFSWRLRQDAQIFLPLALVEHWKYFLQVLAQFTCTLRFEEGEGYVLNNRRWFHGRNSFEGERRVIRLLITGFEGKKLVQGFQSSFVTTAPTENEVSLIGNAIAEFRSADQKGQLFGLTVGGAAANTAQALNEIGVKTSIISAVGNDSLGDFVIKRLAEQGIDTRSIIRVPDRITPVTVASSTTNGKTQFSSYLFEGVSDPLSALTLENLKQTIPFNSAVFDFTEAIIRSPLQRQLLQAMIAERKIGKAKIVYAVNFRPQAWGNLSKEAIRSIQLDVIKDCDLMICNKSEFLFLIGRDDDCFDLVPHQLLSDSAFKALAKVVIITSDSRDVLVLGPFGWCVVPVVAQRAGNSSNHIGAGDSFHAGVLYSIYKYGYPKCRFDWIRTVKYGCVLASQHVTGQPAAPPSLSFNERNTTDIPPKTLILFDIDGTLVRTEEASLLAWNSCLSSILGSEVDIQKLTQTNQSRLQMDGTTDLKLFEEVLEALNISQEKIRSYVNLFFQRLPHCLEEAFITKPPCSCPGVKSLLKGILSSTTAEIALLTGNSLNSGLVKLKACDIDLSFFNLEFSAFGDTERVRSRLVEKVIKDSHNMLWDRVIVIGDTPEDVKAAKDNNCISVAVATGHYSFQDLQVSHSDLVISQFSDDQEENVSLLGFLPNRSCHQH